MSAFGCYLKTLPRGAEVKVEGSDPDAHYVAKDKALGAYGCKGQWQSTTAIYPALVYNAKAKATPSSKPAPADEP